MSPPRRDINLNIVFILLSQLLGPCLVDAEHAGSEAEYIGEEVRGTEILFLLMHFRIFEQTDHQQSRFPE